MDAGRYVRGGFDIVIAKLHKVTVGILTVNSADTGPKRMILEEKILHAMGFEDRREYTHSIPGKYYAGHSWLWSAISGGCYEENSYPGDGFYTVWVFDTSDWEASNVFLLSEYFKGLINAYIGRDMQSPLLIYPTTNDIKMACRPAKVDIDYHLWFCTDWNE